MYNNILIKISMFPLTNKCSLASFLFCQYCFPMPDTRWRQISSNKICQAQDSSHKSERQLDYNELSSYHYLGCQLQRERKGLQNVKKGTQYLLRLVLRRRLIFCKEENCFSNFVNQFLYISIIESLISITHCR